MPRWTLESRQRQSQLIKSWEPWQHSTGPRTDEGKARSSQNAQLTGIRAELRLMVREAAAAVQFIKKLRRQGLLK